MTEVLRVEDLRVRYRTRLGDIRAVNGVNFALQESSIMCLVGESGSGKSTVALAMMGLLPHNGDVTEGKVLFQEQDLLRISFGRLRRIRGKDITMVFQEPQSALNPIQSIGDQLVETIRTHTGSKKEQASRMAEESLREMGLPDPPQIMGRYPFQVSGGQAQRIMLAMALTLRPKVLVADEPTSSIDVTLQAEILARLKGYVQDWGCSILLITHDMGVVAHMADEVAVMYGGSIVEHADVRGLFHRPYHPYTWGIFQALPRMDEADRMLQPLQGTPPTLLNLPDQCPFVPRCPKAVSRCREETMPHLDPVAAGHQIGLTEWSRQMTELGPAMRETGQASWSRRSGTTYAWY